uniref:ATP synthase subunit a n=1 Tax=Aleurocanthus spiniferus TaxID=593793 RepID=A0A0X8PGT3_ALESP|nr:ATP synthase F0 subunit 6 [Aleurocanthus spiniferus]AHY04218.1 ATP synthase F0 subunit 6 [Aleurocanthus spiniferus]
MTFFQVYDPHTAIFGLSHNWVFVGFFFFFFFGGYWCAMGSWSLTEFYLVRGLLSEFKNFFSVMKSGFGLLMFICLFIYILFVNLLGLVPYTFACSAHFVFALSLGLPMWLGFMLLGWFNFTNSMFCHLIPVGTPVVLISFMVVIETISNLIRPWSLSIRLMANMISGHLLMSLLGDCGIFLVFMQLVLFSFEFFVCFIQSYVFSALLTLYSSEI